MKNLHMLSGIGFAVLIVIVIATWWFLSPHTSQFGSISPSSITGAPYTGEPLLGNYQNKDFRFALDIPKGFTVGELPKDEKGGTTIVLQNKEGQGIQIYIIPDTTKQKILTADAIRTAIPDLKIDNVESVDIGPEYKGVAFLSDNPAFGGASREVWFYFRGNLYQISTYAKLDTLLKAMFATWKFF